MRTPTSPLWPACSPTASGAPFPAAMPGHTPREFTRDVTASTFARVLVKVTDPTRRDSAAKENARIAGLLKLAEPQAATLAAAAH